MSDYVPTTEEVRDYIRAADRVTAHMFAEAADSVEAFDRWLAAHDAKMRASLHIVPCARCGEKPVVANDAVNSDIVVCGDCGVQIGSSEAESDPAKDERLVRYMAMVTPLGYESALSVVQQMTLMIQAETEARRAGVVAEEPEWEWVGEDKTTRRFTDNPQVAQGWLKRGFTVRRRTKQIPAGPWLPAEQGETDA